MYPGRYRHGLVESIERSGGAGFSLVALSEGLAGHVAIGHGEHHCLELGSVQQHA